MSSGHPLDFSAGLFMSSIDVGTVSWVAPTVECRAAGHSRQLAAQGTMPAAHKGPRLAAKAEFAAFRARSLSKNPIDDGVVPPLDMAAG